MKYLFLILSFIPFAAHAQLQTSLVECQRAADANYPLLGQSALLQEINDANIQKINAIWQPQIYLNAQATYQSEVTSLPISFPGIEVPELSKDQYKATIDISQTLYDGGISAQQKAIAGQNLAVEMQKVEVDKFKIRDKVNQIYMSVLMADARIELLTIAVSDLNTVLSISQVGKSNGVVSDQQILILQAEIMKTEQQLTEIKAIREGAIRMLAVLTALPLNASYVFTRPEPAFEETVLTNERPELQLYSHQRNLAGLQQQYAEAATLPKVSLFAQGGYGKPGLNFLVDSFSLFYLGGIKVSYPLWTGDTKRRDARIFALNSEIIGMQQLQFEQSINVQSAQFQSDIEKYKMLLTQDDSLVNLRTAILMMARVQLEQGVLSTKDYIMYAKDLDDARINRSIHDLQLEATKVNYLNTLGK
jgi:outer membrane protein TolC